ncbi:MAG: OmpA family protein [Flavobacteriia bacterium]|jgi:outer membrane protein OmpA-like peptidoglycan-associated protein
MKSNIKTLAAFLLVLPLSLNVYAQKTEKTDKNKKGKPEAENLVENGSFEATTGKIKKLGSIDLATGWSSPTGVRADLFLPADKIPEINTPNNFYGKEEPKEGMNYAGIVAYSYNDKMPRSYIMAKLKTPLKKGMKYCVSFNVSLAELSKYASNNVGAILAKKAYGTDAKASIIEKPSVLHHENKVFNAFYNWERVCGTFESEGGEKNIIIGNFVNNEGTTNERMKMPKDIKGTPIIAAYYYIDDVSVTLLEEGKVCECGIGDLEDEVSSTIYQRPNFMKAGATDKEKIEAQASFFAFGKNKLQPEAMKSLDLIAEALKANPTFKLEIKGFADAKEIAKAEENPLYQNMDQKRIDIAIRYLTDKGISEDRIISSPMGSEGENSEIQETDDEDMKDAKTRRITFSVK